MTTKNEIEEFARTIALNTMVAFLLAEHYKAQPDPDEASREHLRLLERLSDVTEVVAKVSAAEKDVVAQAMRDAMIRLALRARSQALHQPFDPADVRKPWR